MCPGPHQGPSWCLLCWVQESEPSALFYLQGQTWFTGSNFWMSVFRLRTTWLKKNGNPWGQDPETTQHCLQYRFSSPSLEGLLAIYSGHFPVEKGIYWNWAVLGLRPTLIISLESWRGVWIPPLGWGRWAQVTHDASPGTRLRTSPCGLLTAQKSFSRPSNVEWGIWHSPHWAPGL